MSRLPEMEVSDGNETVRRLKLESKLSASVTCLKTPIDASLGSDTLMSELHALIWIFSASVKSGNDTVCSPLRLDKDTEAASNSLGKLRLTKPLSSLTKSVPTLAREARLLKRTLAGQLAVRETEEEAAKKLQVSMLAQSLRHS